jgi:predicted nucleic acid-binding protein
MSRVFWDSMLFIYLVEDDPKFAPVVSDVLGRCLRRQDTLFTSHLSVAETLVGIEVGSEKEKAFLSSIDEMGFSLLSFDRASVASFRMLRRDFGLRSPDSLHLACAAAANVDLFLTGDTQLLQKRLRVPGIDFITGLDNTPL